MQLSENQLKLRPVFSVKVNVAQLQVHFEPEILVICVVQRSQRYLVEALKQIDLGRRKYINIIRAGRITLIVDNKEEVW